MKNIETDIDIWKFQNFNQLNGGIQFQHNTLKEFNAAPTLKSLLQIYQHYFKLRFDSLLQQFYI